MYFSEIIITADTVNINMVINLIIISSSLLLGQFNLMGKIHGSYDHLVSMKYLQKEQKNG